MSVRLTLFCAGAGPAVREARFDDGPLDTTGLHEVRAVADSMPAAALCLRSPSVRCAQTADALGVEAEARQELRDLDTGHWRGRTLGEVAGADPEGLAQWTTDPGAAPHGGESVEQLCARVADWMDALPGDAGRVLCVVEPAVVRAGIVHALGTPPAAFWRIDVPPLSGIVLTGRSGRWNMRTGGV
ncbi:histidine phosphatase family protein [Streptomyces sp. NPDC059176]|uniref:histidine phosphatase family protein n=1 Tax=unclassified Streptomyces TaxID=2593676 RepID=UPI0036881193